MREEQPIDSGHFGREPAGIPQGMAVLRATPKFPNAKNTKNLCWQTARYYRRGQDSSHSSGGACQRNLFLSLEKRGWNPGGHGNLESLPKIPNA